MTHDPQRDNEPKADTTEAAEAPPSPETEHTEDEGEPLGANLA